MTDVKQVPIVELKESKTNPRRAFGEEGMKELVASVERHGVLVPLLVRPKNGKYEILAGARRYRAAKKAKLGTLLVRIHDVDDAAALEIMVIENLQREDVHEIEEAEGYRQLIDKHQYDVDKVAAKIGKSISYVYQRLKLAELVEGAKQAFLAGEITAGHAIHIARLQPADQVRAIAHIKSESKYGNHVSVRRLADWIERDIHLVLSRGPWKKDDETLVPAAGSCESCPKRTGNCPELYPDIKRKDICTDRSCFEQKVDAWNTREKKRLEKEGVTLVTLTDDYQGSPKKGVYGTSEFNVAENKKCSHAQKGTYRKGTRRAGQIVDVCTNRKCATHSPYSSFSGVGAKTPKEKAKERDHREQLQSRRETRGAVLREILGKVTYPLEEIDFRLFVKSSFRRLWSDYQKAIFAFYGWPKEEARRRGGYGYDWQAAACKRIDKMNKNEVARFAMSMLMIVDIDGDSWMSDKSLVTIARRRRIDVPKRETAALKRIRAERKAKDKIGDQKKGKAKKSKKGRA